jgi:hypothetical protein
MPLFNILVAKVKRCVLKRTSIVRGVHQRDTIHNYESNEELCVCTIERDQNVLHFVICKFIQSNLLKKIIILSFLNILLKQKSCLCGIL